MDLKSQTRAVVARDRREAMVKVKNNKTMSMICN